ncbi:MAG TPA: PHB depolymerase family esterase [Candidatus Limnocylindrales bacterium]
MRALGIIACLLATAGLAACNVDSPEKAAPAESTAPGDHNLTLQWGGKDRTYRVHAPPGYDGRTPLPLVVTMHFYPGTALQIVTTSGMSAKADKEGFLVLYPEGVTGGYNALVCCGSEDDVGFIKALVERMVTVWKADPKRVYATGISNGGDMSIRLAVEAAGTFAAVAPVSGGIGGRATDASYKPTKPVSLITFIGGNDRYYSAFDTGLKSWRERLACNEPLPIATVVLPNEITLEAFKCGDGSDLAIYRLPKMGHSWPGAKAGGLSDPGAGIDATEIMWEFFKAHRLA